MSTFSIIMSSLTAASAVVLFSRVDLAVTSSRSLELSDGVSVSRVLLLSLIVPRHVVSQAATYTLDIQAERYGGLDASQFDQHSLKG
jgi:hypothetical protein